ncbi:MAG: YjbQ family protein [Syntrophomonadaceae bacterium]|nr:YjbQ family protein [Syntrophomonadaceae bacterium]
MIHEINLRSSKRDEMMDITGQVQRIVTQEAVLEGLAVVYAAHTTAGITINENADPDVTKDLLRRLDEICPWDMAADRHGEGNSAAHLKASMVGTSQTLIIRNGRLLLGTWQGIYFCEFDGPRSRTCYVKIGK